MNLIAGEKILLESSPRGLVLTSHRIRSIKQGVGTGEVMSIMLEELSSCAVERKSEPSLLFIALFIVVASPVVEVTSRGTGAIAIAVVVAVILVIIYLSSRAQILTLTSTSGAKISRSTKGMSNQSVEEFITAAETAKNARYLLGRAIQSQEIE